MMRQPPRHIYRQPTVLATGVQATLKWFDPARGFGFVRPADGSPDALLPGAVLKAAGHESLPDGTTLVVDLVGSRKGAQVGALHSIDTSTARPATARPATARPAGKAPPRSRTDGPGGFSRDDLGRDVRGRDDRGRDARSPRHSAAPRAAEPGPATEVDGTVKWFDTAKGFGFIAPDGGGRDVFVHARALERSGLTTLSEKQRVRVTVRQGDKGPEAVSITQG
jgi:CspA family cold shock protein